jgi:hypothetical protein
VIIVVIGVFFRLMSPIVSFVSWAALAALRRQAGIFSRFSIKD